MFPGADVDRVVIDGGCGLGLFLEVVRVNFLELLPGGDNGDNAVTCYEVEVPIGINRGRRALAAEFLDPVAIDHLSLLGIHRSEHTAGTDEVNDAVVEERRGNLGNISVYRPACVGFGDIA